MSTPKPNINVNVSANGNSTIVGHSLSFYPLVCNTAAGDDQCEFNEAGKFDYSFTSSSDSHTISTPNRFYYAGGNYTYYFIIDNTNYDFDFAQDNAGNYDILNLNYTGTQLPVFRFYNVNDGSHFYTQNLNEKRYIEQNSSDTYLYESVSYFADTSKVGSELAVHRFYNLQNGTHFYTSNQSEATYVNNNLYATYHYEGISYYAQPTQVTGTLPVHRFYNIHDGSHFYTSNQGEATYINNNSYDTYRYEGIAFYAYQ